MRVLIVDDSVVIRRLVADALEAAGIWIAGSVGTGEAALEWLASTPSGCDAVVLDIEMPGISGIECVRELRARGAAIPVVIFSSHASTASEHRAALDAGADAVVHKPANVGSVRETRAALAGEIVPLLERLSTHRASHAAPTAPPAHPAPAEHQSNRLAPHGAIVIGASTGGPDALALVARTLPFHLPIPIVIAQHMPAGFSEQLAARIARAANRPAVLTSDGARLAGNTIYVAPGGTHLSLERSGSSVVCTHSQLPNLGIHPSVDVLFRTASDVWGAAALFVVLTGMGSDGLAGAVHAHSRGAQVIAQDEATSVVWGMPRAVASAGIARVLPLHAIPEEIARFAASMETAP